MTSFDEKFVNEVVDKLKKQGLFDQFRKECLSDIDTKPAYQNLQTRVQGAVDRFLSNHKWTSQLKKNVLRDSLRKHLNELPMLSNGIERVVDQVINPKFISYISPLIDNITCQHLGINYDEWKKNREEQDKIIADAKIPSLLEIDTSIPSYNKSGLLSPFYPPQNHQSSQNSFANQRFHNPNYDLNIYPPFNPYTMRPFMDNFYDSSQNWPLGPIHPDFGVPLPTMPYIPEPAPPLPEDDPQTNVKVNEIAKNEIFKNNLEQISDEDAPEISVENHDNLNNSSQNKSYHFEWENYDDNAISDISVSSVHTSDLSSLEDDNEDEDENKNDNLKTIEEVITVNQSIEVETNPENETSENSSPFKLKADSTPSSGKKIIQRSKEQMKEERRERKITEKKRMLWNKMNNSIQNDVSDNNILIEEDFATVEEEIIENEDCFNFKDKFITLDEASNYDFGNHDQDKESVKESNKNAKINSNGDKEILTDFKDQISGKIETCSIECDDASELNINKDNIGFQSFKDDKKPYDDEHNLSKFLNKELDISRINLPESKNYDISLNNKIIDCDTSTNISENNLLKDTNFINLHPQDLGLQDSTILKSTKTQHLDDGASYVDESINIERDVQLDNYDIIDDISASDDDFNAFDVVTDYKNDHNIDELKKNYSSKLIDIDNSSVNLYMNVQDNGRHKRSKSKDAKIQNIHSTSTELHKNPKHSSIKLSPYKPERLRRGTSKDIKSHSQRNVNKVLDNEYKSHSDNANVQLANSKSQTIEKNKYHSCKDIKDSYKGISKSHKNDRNYTKSGTMHIESSRLRRRDKHISNSYASKEENYRSHSKIQNETRASRHCQEKDHEKNRERSLNMNELTQVAKKHRNSKLSPISKRLRR